MRDNSLTPGRRVRVARPIELFPHGVVPVGETGRVVRHFSASGDVVAVVLLDRYVDFLDEWENELHVQRPGRGGAVAADFELL